MVCSHFIVPLLTRHVFFRHRSNAGSCLTSVTSCTLRGWIRRSEHTRRCSSENTMMMMQQVRTAATRTRWWRCSRCVLQKWEHDDDDAAGAYCSSVNTMMAMQKVRTAPARTRWWRWSRCVLTIATKQVRTAEARAPRWLRGRCVLPSDALMYCRPDWHLLLRTAAWHIVWFWCPTLPLYFM